MKSEQFERRINLLPDKDNENIKRIALMLGIENEPFYLDIIPDKDTENGDCFENVFRKVKNEKGEIVYGWQFCEYHYMVEGEFHAIWKSPDEKLVDITPSSFPGVNKSLFVIDGNRKFKGQQTDNVRLNTTQNEFVDDIIEVLKARYRFMNKGERANIIGELHLVGEDISKWNLINFYSNTLEQLYFENWTIQTECFCNSGKIYDHCHRNIFKQFIASI